MVTDTDRRAEPGGPGIVPVPTRPHRVQGINETLRLTVSDYQQDFGLIFRNGIAEVTPITAERCRHSDHPAPKMVPRHGVTDLVDVLTKATEARVAAATDTDAATKFLRYVAHCPQRRVIDLEVSLRTPANSLQADLPADETKRTWCLRLQIRQPNPILSKLIRSKKVDKKAAELGAQLMQVHTEKCNQRPQKNCR